MAVTAKPRNTLNIKFKKVTTAYIARKIVEDVETSETLDYTFGSNGNNTSNAKGKKKIAGIIFNKETKNGHLNKTKRTTLEKVESVLIKAVYNKGEVIQIPLLKEKISFKKIDSASLGDDVYIVIETENLQGREIKMNLKQANANGIEEQYKAITVQQDGKEVLLITATVGDFECNNTSIQNLNDFQNWAIAKVTLEPKDATQKKAYLDTINKAENKKTNLYLAIDAESKDNNWAEVLYDEVFNATPNVWLKEEGKQFGLGCKKENSEYYIYKSGKIDFVKGVNKKYEFFIELKKGKFELIKTLEENSFGLVKFPSSGNGFNRYGTVDKGGKGHGAGDHYLLPRTAASIYGVINEISLKGWEIHLGDMSSVDGKDPWQPGSKHHSGHGGKRGRKGLDIDFRYLNKQGKSFHGLNSSSNFDKEKNIFFFKTAYKYGFKKNYCTNVKKVLGKNLVGVKDISYHEDHGHIGLVL